MVASPVAPNAVWAGRYQIRRLLGEGSRKRVYLAHDARLDREVALALIKGETLEPASVARLQRETQTMGRLGDHPHIVTVYDVGEEADHPYIVSQFMAGGSIEELLQPAEGQSPRGLQLEVVLRLADHVCRALEHAHAHGVVHRDLKPANVWLTTDGTAKLGDFGLALARDRSRMTVEGMMVGTVAYMAPEQALGRAVDARSDLYALGALLYELVTGRPPFVGDGAVAVVTQHLHTQPVAPSWHNASIPPPLEALILQLLEKDPAKRPSTASNVREALERIKTGPVTESTSAAQAAVLATLSPAPAPPSAPNPLDRLEAGVFVGREAELAALRGAVEEALGGRGRLVLIGGEPGIGKTRLVQELATYAQLRGMQVLWGRCHEGGGAPAYWPWVQAIRTYVHERPTPELRAALGAGAPEIATVVSAVRERLPDLPAPARLEPEQERFRLFDSVTMFLQRVAAQQSIMLVIDDLHWADVPSLLLLQFLVREMDRERLVVVATYRDEEAGPGQPVFASLAELARAPVSRRVALAGLDEAEIAQLIERTAGGRPTPALVTTVVAKTDGNPFFVGEVVRWLVAQGQWTDGSGASPGVPPSVREVIMRRLQRLSPACNQLLSSAAVVGRDFPLALLARVRGESEDALLALAEEAVAARVLTELDAQRYSFVHALIRETLYAELSPARRRPLHRQIGEALEALYAARLDHHLPALAYHFGQAGSAETAERAAMYAQCAGDRSLKLTAYEDAAAYYERVLQALDRAEQPEPRRRAEVLLGLGNAEFGSGKPVEEARARFLEAATIFRELGASELLARTALAYAFGPRLPSVADTHRSRLLEEAHTALATEDSPLHAVVLSRLAFNIAEDSGDPERVTALCDAAVEMARRHADPETMGYVLTHAASAQWRPESFPRRLAWLEELRAVCARGADRHLQLQLQMLLITTFIRLGDRAALDAAVSRYISLAEGLRVPWFMHFTHQLRAMQATMEGRFSDAERNVQDAFAVGGAVHPALAQVIFGGMICLLRWEQGRIAELEPVVTDLVERQPRAALWRAVLALLHCELGRTDAARRELEQVVEGDLATVPVWPSYWPVTLGILAEVSACVGDTRRAAMLAAALRPFADMCLVGGDDVCLGAAARHLGMLAAALRDWDTATRHFERALAINTGLGAPTLVARTQYHYAAMLLARGAVGDRRRAFALLGAAVDTAQTLGMKLLLERALALKMQAQGSNSVDLKTSIDMVAAEVAAEHPDLRAHSAPDGTVTIFFSDMEGFTAMTERLGDRRAHALLAAHNRIIREQLARHGGFEVKSQGDGFMVAFQSARRAVLCAIAVQRAFTGYAAEHPEEPIRVRIGLHTGEAIRDAGDFFGTAVNFAARIAGAARGGEILVSPVLKELTAGAGEVRYGAGRPLTLKGLSGVRTLFAVLWGGEPDDTHADAAALPPDTAVLRREGAYWTLHYAGSTGRLKDTRGLRYLARLLREPGREFHVIDLAQAAAGASPDGDGGGPTVAHAGLAPLDAAAKADYRRRLSELRDDLEEAERFNDAGRGLRAREEIEAITAQLADAVGLGGRDRAVGSTAERARSTVTKRIKDALKQIRELNPPLGDHMSRRVKTGVFCAYLPDNTRPIEWALD